MATNRIKLTICDTEYIITSDESESYVRELEKSLTVPCVRLWRGIPGFRPPWRPS